MNLRTRLPAAATTLLGLWALDVPLARADMGLGLLQQACLTAGLHRAGGWCTCTCVGATAWKVTSSVRQRSRMRRLMLCCASAYTW